MRKRTTQTVFVLFLALTVCFLIPMNARSAPDKKFSAVLKTGGGAVGGIGYMVLTGMSKTVREAYPRMDITVVPGGWVGNLFRVDKGELDIGSTTTAMCSLAESHKAPFDKPLPNIRALYSTQDKLYYFAIVTKETPVDSVEELFEKKPPVRLCTLQKGTTTELMWRNLFQSQGLTWDDISDWGGKINHVAWGDAVNLVKDGHADGILAVGVRQLGWAMDLTNARDMKILKWGEGMFKLLNEKFGFGTDTIPGGTYPGIDDDVMCPHRFRRDHREQKDLR